VKNALFLLFATILLLLSANADAQDKTVRRFALIVGVNSGGPERELLRYAATDARSFAAVMEQLGGVHPDDKSLLLNPNRNVLQAAFSEMAAKISKAKKRDERIEFLFYFSGHSDEVGLLLDTEKLSYREARASINQLPADVRIAVLDSCASGAFTRLKGGKHRQPFLYDASTSVKGHAFLTSSSQDETAQESDRIRASFFTHYLVSGLRGAADLSGDGRVTLNEAYRFAFDETLAQTESSKGGAQHPAYDIQLQGTGDLVMTDLRQTSATLSIDVEIDGRLYIREPSGQLVAELYKTKGRVVELGLPPGEYHVVADQNGRLSRARVLLPDNRVTRLKPEMLNAIQPEETVARGSADQDENALPAAAVETPAATPKSAEDKTSSESNISKKEKKPEDEYQRVPFAISLFPPVDNTSKYKKKVINNFGLNFVFGRVARVKGAQVGFGVNRVDEKVRGAQLALGGNISNQRIRGGQGSIGFNVTSKLLGIQTAVGFNFAQPVRGAQASVGANIAQQLEGVQATVGANIASRIRGAQASVGANIVYEEVTGIQTAVGPNWTPALQGAQASLVNVAGKVRGAQIGLVNVSSGPISGAQIGLVNYADQADVSLGLIGITRKGGIHPVLWTSDTGLLNAGLRFDAKYTYTFIAAGFYPFGDGRSGLFGVGLGLKIGPFDRFWIDTDVSTYVVTLKTQFSGNPGLHQLRVLARYQFMPHFAVFAGPSLSLLTHWNIDDREEDRGLRPGYDYKVYEYVENHIQLSAWPGFAAGFQF